MTPFINKVHTILVIMELLTRYVHFKDYPGLNVSTAKLSPPLCLPLLTQTQTKVLLLGLVVQLARNPGTSFDSPEPPTPKQTSIKSCALSLLIASPLFFPLPRFRPQVESYS